MLAWLRKCVALVPPEMRWRWAALLPLIVVTAIGEAVGAAATYVLVKIVADPAQATTAPLAAIFTAWVGPGERTPIVAFAAAIAVFFVLKNLLLIGTVYIRSRCVGETMAALSATMLRGYLRVPYAFHLRRNSAELVRNTDQAIHRVFIFVLSPALSVITEGLVVAGIVVVLLAAAPLATVCVGAVLLLVSAGFLRLTRHAAAQLGEQLHTLSKGVLQHLQQALGAAKEIKVLGREGFFVDAFARTQQRLRRVRYLHETLSALPRIVVETLFICGALSVVVLVTIGRGSVPDIVSVLGLYAYAGFRIIPSANRILWMANDIRVGGAAINEVYDDFVAIGGYAARAPDAVAQPARPFVDRLEFDGVSYTHPGADTPALRDVTLTIRRGESIGVVGPTGAGKSTLVDLLVGLLDPTSGQITIDGSDLRTQRRTWQRQIGYVPQSIFLVDDSIRRNIALGIADDAVDLEQLRAAAHTAQLDEFTVALPEGLDTIVGERGVRLSGGERQRVGVARALYHRPAVLVFDEATSALDNRTEAELVGAIETQRGAQTFICVAHRLSTVRRCDRLIFVRDGCIAGVGSFDELLAHNEDFRRMTVASEGSGSAD